jgi:hypothetical protein
MKRKLKKIDPLAADLRVLLNEWDLIGSSPPPDEYDCLIGPLLSKLRSDCNQEFITKFLNTEIKDHFGMRPECCGTDHFAKKVCEWYSQRRRNR